MTTQDRVMLALTIFVLVVATVLNLVSHRSGLSVVTGTVLVVVVVVRVIVPGVHALRPKKPDQS